jgi:hypothetical protein
MLFGRDGTVFVSATNGPTQKCMETTDNYRANAVCRAETVLRNSYGG